MGPGGGGTGDHQGQYKTTVLKWVSSPFQQTVPKWLASPSRWPSLNCFSVAFVGAFPVCVVAIFEQVVRARCSLP